MAKPQSAKQPTKASEPPETVAAAPAAPPNEQVTPPASGSPTPAAAKKEPARARKPLPAKNGSLLPSAYKLEQLSTRTQVRSMKRFRTYGRYRAERYYL